ncbi:Zn-ribbon domain-containing OB-fold protein [Nocardia sp. CA-119907]|uniref:Zn-ribbon domain-containing OB-fold protein n=1 Tax=Nocardia sp. CA-119907 TaxID=3239973 RepID=UPI003D991373
MYAHDPERTDNVSDDGARRAEGTLMIRRCADCDKLFAPLTAECSSCVSEALEWVPSSGAGSIVSWRVVDRAATGRRDELMPLTIAIVELDEGPWVYTAIDGEVPLLPAGPVRVQYQPNPKHNRFPVFTVNADPRNSVRVSRTSAYE